jgi:hypothetical protein
VTQCALHGKVISSMAPESLQQAFWSGEEHTLASMIVCRRMMLCRYWQPLLHLLCWFRRPQF